jgi:hypothetical protein
MKNGVYIMKTKKIIIVFIVMFTLGFIKQNTVYANPLGQTSSSSTGIIGSVFSEISKGLIDWGKGIIDDAGKTELTNIPYNDIRKVINTIYTYEMIIAVIGLIAYGVYQGYRMILGGLDEKVEAKEMLWPYFKTVIIVAFVQVIFRFILNVILKIEAMMT